MAWLEFTTPEKRHARRVALRCLFASAFAGVGWRAHAKLPKLTLAIEVDASTRGRDAAQAIEFAVREVSREASLPFTLTRIDTQGNPLRALDALTNLARSQTLLGVLGGGDANLAPRIARWANAERIPYGITWASDVANRADDPWSTNLGLNDAQCLQQLLREAIAQQKNRWGFLLSNDALGRASYDALLALLPSASQLQLVSVQWHELAADEIGAQWTQMRAQGAQGIWVAAHPRAIRALMAHWEASPRSAPGLSSASSAPLTIASSNAWSAQTTKTAPLYFALPPASGNNAWITDDGRAWVHPARHHTAQFLQSALVSVRASVQASEHDDLPAQRVRLAKNWQALVRADAPSAFTLYRMSRPGQWQARSLADALASEST